MHMKLIAVDDHPLMQQALARALPELDASLEVIGAEDRDETLTALARHPDAALILLDLTLPGARGLDLLAQIVRDFPRIPVLVLSATHDRPTVTAALAAGARGYVAKTARPDELLGAVRDVLRGGRSVTRDIRRAAPSVDGVPPIRRAVRSSRRSRVRLRRAPR